VMGRLTLLGPSFVGIVLCVAVSFVILIFPPPPSPTLFPYTTLFRSPCRVARRECMAGRRRSSSSTAAVLTRPWPRRCFRAPPRRSEEHTSELQSRFDVVCRLLLEKTKSPAVLAPERCLLLGLFDCCY